MVMTADEREQYRKNIKRIQNQLVAAHIMTVSGTGKEIKYLAKVIDFDNHERVLAALSGLVNGNTVLIVCTTMRVLFIDRGLIYGVRTSEIPLDKVNDITYSQGLIYGKISVTNGANTTQINWVDKRATEHFVKAVRHARDAFCHRDNSLHLSKHADDGPAYIKELKELKQLLDAGILTQAEFDQKKRQILDSKEEAD